MIFQIESITLAMIISFNDVRAVRYRSSVSLSDTETVRVQVRMTDRQWDSQHLR